MTSETGGAVNLAMNVSVIVSPKKNLFSCIQIYNVCACILLEFDVKLAFFSQDRKLHKVVVFDKPFCAYCGMKVVFTKKHPR